MVFIKVNEDFDQIANTWQNKVDMVTDQFSDDNKSVHRVW